jgi:hypothetical protein
MNVQKDIFSNKLYLKQINKNFNDLIQLVQTTYLPLPLSPEESLGRKIISFEFFQEFNGSNQNEQIQFLSNVNDTQQLWTFLSLNPMSYDCQMFLEELYQLTLTSLSVKQHLGKSILSHL